MKHSTDSASPWFPLELNCCNEEQNSVPFSWISDKGVFSQLSTNFFPAARLHEIKGGIFSALSRLAEWHELHWHSHCNRHFPHIPHYGDKFPMADGVPNTVIIFFSVLSSERQCDQNSQCLARCLPSRHQPQSCFEDVRQVLGEDKSAELKSLSEESKRLRQLLVKSGQLQKARYRSRGWNESCQEPFKVSKFCGMLPGFEDQICIWQSFSLAVFWKRLLSFL